MGPEWLAPDGVDAVADFVGGVVEQTTAVLADGGRNASVADPEDVASGGSWRWVRPDTDDLERLVVLVDQGSVTVAVEDLRARGPGYVRGKVAIRISE